MGIRIARSWKKNGHAGYCVCLQLSLAVVVGGLWNQIHSTASAEDRASTQPAEKSAEVNDAERIAAALKLGLPMVQKAATRYPDHRKCFSCHHQTLPLLAMTSGRASGATIDETVLKTQAEFTQASFQKQKEDLLAGKGIGGKAMTVGYGLWALRLANWPADEITEAMVEYLLKTQSEDGHWELHSIRPPMEDSTAMCAVLVIAGLRKYAGESQQAEMEKVVAKAGAWLAGATPRSQEDKAARLWGSHLLSSSREDLNAARDAVLAGQREDGGWAQLEEMASDAYATGQTLFVLRSTGFDVTAPAYRRGVAFLLATQRDDGSWFVQTRSKPVQVYFDNGDPHGANQFISTPTTCWALSALAMPPR